VSQRTRDMLILVILAVIVNGIVAGLVTDPGYTDSYYYFNGGQFIASGKGLTEPYRWNYVNAPSTLPAPGFDFWQPLPAMLAAAGIVLFGRSSPFDSAQTIFVIACAFLPIITYSLASQLGERRLALIAGLLTVFSGFYVVYWSLPESFTPFALSGAGSLALMGLARRRGNAWLWLLAGMCTGVAHLARADGLLLVVVGMITALTPGRSGWKAAAVLAGGYLLVMTPWFVRNQLAFGSPLPPGGINAAWLIEYNDLFNYPQNIAPARYFASGWATILRVKWDALAGNLTSFVAVQNLIFLTPLTLIGAWRRRRESWLMPVLIYQITLFGVMTFVFALPGLRGGYFHSASALLPATFTLAASGLDDVVRWATALRGWHPASARRVFGAAAVGMAACLTIYLVLARVVGLPLSGQVAWNQTDSVYRQVGQALDQIGAGPDTLIMSNNPPGFYYYTGRGGMPVPNGDEQTVLQAARDYDLRFLVIDHNVPTPLVDFFQRAPSSPQFSLIKTFGSGVGRVILYGIVTSP
jgi:hypothetical protein